MHKLRFGRAFFGVYAVIAFMAFLFFAEGRLDLSRYVPAPHALADLPALWRLIVAVLAAGIAAAILMLAVVIADPDWDDASMRDSPPPSKWALVYGWTKIGIAGVFLLLALFTFNPLLLLGTVLYGGVGAWWINDYYRDLRYWEDFQEKLRARAGLDPPS
jgi:hypothetical protein